MLRTNSKQAVENIKSYILTDSDYIKERAEYDGVNLTGTDEILSYAWKCFEDEMSYRIEQNYNNPNFGIFLDWARGLALGGLFLYYYNTSAKDILGDILEETEAEREKYTEQQAEETLSRLIYRELENANRREFLKTVKTSI